MLTDTPAKAAGTGPTRASTASARLRPASRPRGRGRAPRPRVLLCDPDADVLQSTALLVEGLGYAPVQVLQPGEALEEIERTRPGLVLLEPQFPGLNVAGLLASLRSHPGTSDLPIVFFSASKELSATAVRHGVWGTLAKPFAVRELAHLLQAALGPPPEAAVWAGERAIESEVRDAFREMRNMITALDNYLALLDQAEELSRPSKLAVRRLADLTLRMEAKTEHLRAFVLSLMLPPPHDPAAPPRSAPRSKGASSKAMEWHPSAGSNEP